MTRLIPSYIGDDEAYMRCIKDGWYAVGSYGMLVSGPFSTYQDCAQEIRHPTRAPIDMPWGRRAPPYSRKDLGSWLKPRVNVAKVAMLTRAGPFWVVD